jgi:Planctomycete cytochrome C
MRKKNLFFFLLLTTSIIFFYACRHELLDPINGGTSGNGGGNPPPTSACSPDTAYFINDIMPIISTNCTMSGCHDNVSRAGDIDLTNYIKIMKFVKSGNPNDSKLYKVVKLTNEDRMPPPPMPPLNQAQKDKIYKWISQGAKNNNCIGSCDSTVFTYSGAVKPIMDNKCAGCHNPANLGGNIDLSVYNSVKLVAVNGKLYGSVAHQPGFSPMPKNGAKLSDCEINQIQKWINAGSLNN